MREDAAAGTVFFAGHVASRTNMIFDGRVCFIIRPRRYTRNRTNQTTSDYAEALEYPGTAMVSLVARGVAEYGAAFGEWVAYVGTQNEDAIARFSDHFIGEWESFEAYVENFLEETDFYRFLDYVPEDMQGYVTVDTEQIAQDWGSDYHVVEAPNGHVFIFDTRA